jgi:hypothetical protein
MIAFHLPAYLKPATAGVKWLSIHVHCSRWGFLAFTGTGFYAIERHGRGAANVDMSVIVLELAGSEYARDCVATARQ